MSCPARSTVVIPGLGLPASCLPHAPLTPVCILPTKYSFTETSSSAHCPVPCSLPSQQEFLSLCGTDKSLIASLSVKNESVALTSSWSLIQFRISSVQLLSDLPLEEWVKLSSSNKLLFLELSAVVAILYSCSSENRVRPIFFSVVTCQLPAAGRRLSLQVFNFCFFL